MKFYRYTFIVIGIEVQDIRLLLNEFTLLRETPKGYWISRNGLEYNRRWIPKESKKRFAYPTKEEAMINFMKRTERHIDLLRWRLKYAKDALNLAKFEFKSDLSEK